MSPAAPPRLSFSPQITALLGALLLAQLSCGPNRIEVNPPTRRDQGTTRPDADQTTRMDQGSSDLGTDRGMEIVPDMGRDEGRADLGPPPKSPGLTAEYFEQYRELVLRRTEPGIDHSWGEESPAAEVPRDFFSARWSGYIVVPADDDYTFWVSTDDGMRLWVDDQLVIDAWRWQFPTRYEGTITLQAGEHRFRVDYMERDLSAEARVGWSSSTIAERILGEGDFLTDGEPSTQGAPQSPYLNPVVSHDCPDPGVAQDPDSGVFYAICTGGRLHVRRSHDLIFWEDSGADVLPQGKPAWAANGRRNWAPEIHKVGSKWIVYYTSVNGADVLCIGAASSDSPTGPYVDLGAPLVEHPQGVIDAHYFRDDDGRHYLTYKIDGNATGRATPIYLRELADDGLSFKQGSRQVELIRNNSSTWEGGVVEAQWIIKRQGRYYMFYSGNVYDHRYRTGVARADSITGPWSKRGAPILTNNARWVGPGHGSVLRVGREDVFVYHAWPALGNGQHDSSEGRHILVDRIRWEGGWPAISNGRPSTTPQPAF